MNQNKKIVVKKKDKKKQLLVLAMAGVLGCSGILGASAFFTDQAHTDAKAKIGGLNMTVQDLSDLDGDYSKWKIDQATGTITEQDSVITTAVKAGVAANAKGDRFTGNYTGRAVTAITKYQATDKDAPSTGIINPGDSGLLQFKVSNVDSKSFRTGVKSSVIVKLADNAVEPDGKTTATLSGDHRKGVVAGFVKDADNSNKGYVDLAYPDATNIGGGSQESTLNGTLNGIHSYGVTDYNAYTIEGMGAPIVEFGHSDDAKTFEVVDAENAGGKTINAMRLTYFTELDTLKGSQENTEATDGKNAEVTYAFETKFNRLAQNKFQGALIDIKTDFYALQNRKTAGTWYSVIESTDKFETTDEVDETKNTLKPATGDWQQIGYFEKVINVKENKTDASLNEDTNSGSVNGTVADGTAARRG